MGELRLSERTMIDKEIFDMAKKIENMGIYLSLISQLDKLWPGTTAKAVSVPRSAITKL